MLGAALDACSNAEVGAASTVTYATGRLQLWEATPGDPASRRFPYGLAIACGTLISVLSPA